MDVVLLRKLTLKSTMKFGKYYDLTVNDIINSQGLKGVQYLTWVYFSADMIDFNDEIKKILGINEDSTIKKPGKVKCEELLVVYLRKCIEQRVINDEDLSEFELNNRKMMTIKEKNHDKKRKLAKINRISRTINNKNHLKAKNQSNFR